MGQRSWSDPWLLPLDLGWRRASGIRSPKTLSSSTPRHGVRELHLYIYISSICMIRFVLVVLGFDVLILFVRYSMEVKSLFKRLGVEPLVIELDELGGYL